MNKIVVFLYSYKDKSLRKSIDSLLNNRSGLIDVSVHVCDKNNLDRSDQFNDVHYEHQAWDSVTNKFSARSKVFDIDSGEYFLSIDGAKSFIKNWDIELIRLLDEGEIISGSNAIYFKNLDHRFFCTYDKALSEDKVLTKWIDPSFIFTTFEIFKSFPKLLELKHNGESEILSLFCFSKLFDIYCAPKDYIVSIDKDILQYDYIPFSINHNYNLVLDVFKKNSNVFFEDYTDLKNFETFINYNFSELSYHPFPENDISYNPTTSLDDIEGERFFGGIKSIY
jgi:hypothetical protein